MHTFPDSNYKEVPVRDEMDYFDLNQFERDQAARERHFNVSFYAVLRIKQTQIKLKSQDFTAQQYDETHRSNSVTRNKTKSGDLRGPLGELLLPNRQHPTSVNTGIGMGLSWERSGWKPPPSTRDDEWGATGVEPSAVFGIDAHQYLARANQVIADSDSDSDIVSVSHYESVSTPVIPRAVHPRVASARTMYAPRDSLVKLSTPGTTGGTDPDMDSESSEIHARSVKRKAVKSIAAKPAKKVRTTDAIVAATPLSQKLRRKDVDTATLVSPIIKSSPKGHTGKTATPASLATNDTPVAADKAPAVVSANCSRTKSPVLPRNAGTGLHPRSFPCIHKGCPQVCNSSGDLRRHLESRAHKTPSYTCLGCSRPPYTRVDALRRHHRSDPKCARRHATASQDQRSQEEVVED